MIACWWSLLLHVFAQSICFNNKKSSDFKQFLSYSFQPPTNIIDSCLSTNKWGEVFNKKVTWVVRPVLIAFFRGKFFCETPILLHTLCSHSRLKSPRNMSSMSQKSKYDLRCNLHRNEHHVLCHSKILKQITHVTFAEEEMAWKVTGSHGQSKHPAIRGKLFNGENVASDTHMLWACTSMSLNL